MSSRNPPGRAAVDRWRTASEMLAGLRRRPGSTRAELARELRLASASATEVTGRLRELGWVVERPAPPVGRGRPTTVLEPAPDGPVVVAVDVRVEDWRCALARLDGRPVATRVGRHERRDPESMVRALRHVVAGLVRDAPGPVVAAGIAVAATVVDGTPIGEGGDQGWGTVDPRGIAPDGVPAVVCNDATLAGVAEARDGAAADAGTALVLIAEVGIGGALLVDGRPLNGARGAGGEFGHLPFGDPGCRCRCGVLGCWNVDVDGRALARHLGEPEPRDPHSLALDVLARARDGDPTARTAVARVTSRLGAGVAGLVNAHDPDVAVVGGLAPALRAASPDAFVEAYTAGLMRWRRGDPPPVRDAVHGADAPLRGAVAIALDEATSPAGLVRLFEQKSRHQMT